MDLPLVHGVMAGVKTDGVVTGATGTMVTTTAIIVAIIMATMGVNMVGVGTVVAVEEGGSMSGELTRAAMDSNGHALFVIYLFLSVTLSLLY